MVGLFISVPVAIYQAGFPEEEPPRPMPNVMCDNLAGAERTLDRAGVGPVMAKDASDAHRFPFVSKNWTVVSQTPAPSIETAERTVELRVLKHDEVRQCP